MHLDVLTLLAVDHASYWFAGVLTVFASLIVVVVMLATSHRDNGDST